MSLKYTPFSEPLHISQDLRASYHKRTARMKSTAARMERRRTGTPRPKRCPNPINSSLPGVGRMGLNGCGELRCMAPSSLRQSPDSHAPPGPSMKSAAARMARRRTGMPRPKRCLPASFGAKFEWWGGGGFGVKGLGSSSSSPPPKLGSKRDGGASPAERTASLSSWSSLVLRACKKRLEGSPITLANRATFPLLYACTQHEA